MIVNRISKIWIILSLLFMVMFHQLNIDLIYLFPFELLFIIPALLYLNKDTFKRIRYNNFKVIGISLLLLSIVNILSSFLGHIYLNTDIVRNLSVSITYILIALYYLYGAVFSIRLNKKTLQNIAVFLLSVTFIVVIIEIYFPPFRIILRDFYNVEKLDSNYLQQLNYRVIGPFKNPNILSLIVIILLTVGYKRHENVYWKVVLIGAATTIIAYTGSRTGFVLLSLYLIFFLFFDGKNFSRKIISLLMLLIIGGGILINIEFESVPILDRLQETELNTALNSRYDTYWDETLDLVGHNPIFGTGLVHNSSMTVDNYFLALAKANGIIGLLLFTFPIIFLFANSVRKGADSKLIFLFIVFFLSSMTGDYYFTRPSYPLLFTLIGYYYNREVFNYKK